MSRFWGNESLYGARWGGGVFVALGGSWPQTSGRNPASLSSTSSGFSDFRFLGCFAGGFCVGFVDSNCCFGLMVALVFFVFRSFAGFRFLVVFWLCSLVVVFFLLGWPLCCLLHLVFCDILNLCRDKAMLVFQPQRRPTPRRPCSGSSWVTCFLLGIVLGTGPVHGWRRVQASLRPLFC